MPPRDTRWATTKLQLVLGAVIVFGSACSESPVPSLPTATPQDPPVFTESLESVPPPYSLAILPFDDYSSRQNLGWLRQGLPDMLTTDLAVLPGVRIVSRQRLGEILREQWLQHRGAFKERPTVRIGRLAGAKYLLTGMFYAVDAELILEVHLLDVEQGEVVRTIRVRGNIQEIPAIELNLAQRLSQLFRERTQSPTVEREGHVQVSRDAGPQESVPPIPRDATDPNGHHRVIQNHMTTSSVSSTDTLLSLERLRTIRDQAAQMANLIWTQGMVVRLKEPQHLPEGSGQGRYPQVLQVWVPVSVEVDAQRMPQLSQDFQLMEDSSQGEKEKFVMAYRDPDQGAQALFLESIQTPRRLFVRAIRESGEVIAVSSDWSWRVDQHVDVKDDGVIEFPSAPAPLISGRAPFESSVFVGPHAPVKFDWVVVPVPQELRTVSVERIQDPLVAGEQPNQSSKLLQSLKAWLHFRWAPPVTESILVPGYLPGNRRTGVILLEGRGNTIQHARVIQLPPEEGVADSIRAVLKDLPGRCFDVCEAGSEDKASSPEPVEFRVQFDLVKDISRAGLHEKTTEDKKG